MSTKRLFVGGKFDEYGGKRSEVVNIAFKSIRSDIEYHNGGHFSQLEKIIAKIHNFELIYWFADVSNDKPKLIQEIKKKNETCVLVTSKRNFGEYTFNDIVAHGLRNKSNLMVEISKQGERFNGRILDPLGNVFLDYEEDFGIVGKVVEKRGEELLGYTRVRSERIDGSASVPNEEEFFRKVRYCGDLFDRISPHKNGDRYFGNASFTDGKMVYMSRRNIDKKDMKREGFVPLLPGLPVRYSGNKPSVDAQVQLKLYEHYRNARYIIHGHVFVAGAQFTDRIVPCGAIEEAEDVIKTHPDPADINFAVNLRGHGTVVIADNLGLFEKLAYRERNLPEVHHEYRNID